MTEPQRGRGTKDQKSGTLAVVAEEGRGLNSDPPFCESRRVRGTHVKGVGRAQPGWEEDRINL